MRFVGTILLFLGCFLPPPSSIFAGTLSNAPTGEYNHLITQLKALSRDSDYLSKEQAATFLAEFQAAYDQALATEQSFENRMLGGLTMAATSIGGQMLASALSEQSADTDAETAMRAYLATFHCDYGAAKNIPGGEKNIELPGGNELISLYSEYVNLANDLKVRKNALGLRPGIESEPILDSATSGLYDDVSIGKTSGAYASLARALSDPNSADAAAWAAQKSDTADKLKTGAIVGGGGALVGSGGNILINHTDKNISDTIKDAKNILSC